MHGIVVQTGDGAFAADPYSTGRKKADARSGMAQRRQIAFGTVFGGGAA